MCIAYFNNINAGRSSIFVHVSFLITLSQKSLKWNSWLLFHKSLGTKFHLTSWLLPSTYYQVLDEACLNLFLFLTKRISFSIACLLYLYSLFQRCNVLLQKVVQFSSISEQFDINENITRAGHCISATEAVCSRIPVPQFFIVGVPAKDRNRRLQKSTWKKMQYRRNKKDLALIWVIKNKLAIPGGLPQLTDLFWLWWREDQWGFFTEKLECWCFLLCAVKSFLILCGTAEGDNFCI